MKYGFTGTRKGASYDTIAKAIYSLDLRRGDWVITGACKGIDSQIAFYVAEHYSHIKQLIIYPFDCSQIGQGLNIVEQDQIQMPKGSNYRQRNEKLVVESDQIVAFWDGRKSFSGTYMTINIAKRANKLHMIVRI